MRKSQAGRRPLTWERLFGRYLDKRIEDDVHGVQRHGVRSVSDHLTTSLTPSGIAMTDS